MTVRSWTLAGDENQPSRGGSAPHPGAYIQEFVTPVSSLQSGFTIPLADGHQSVTPVTVNGLPGFIQAPTSGFGAFIVSWTDGSYVFTFTSMRAQTQDGANGVGAPTLLRMAESV